MNFNAASLDVNLDLSLIVVDSIMISSMNNDVVNVAIFLIIDTMRCSKNSLICVLRLR